jgi:DNA-binding NarL/FixJ family response regulator
MHTTSIGGSQYSRGPENSTDSFNPNTLLMNPRILLADDQEDMLQTVVHALADRFQIVGVARNGRRAVELAAERLPDVVILDISMPTLNGIEAACQVKALGLRSKVIFLSVHADPDFVRAAFCAGGLGYVLKPYLITDLVPAIRAVLECKTFISSSIQLR